MTDDGRIRAAAGGTVLLVAEEMDRRPDEAYTAFTLTLEAELRRRRPLAVHFTRPARWGDRAALRVLRRTVQLAGTRWRPDLRGRPR